MNSFSCRCCSEYDRVILKTELTRGQEAFGHAQKLTLIGNLLLLADDDIPVQDTDGLRMASPPELGVYQAPA